MIRLFIAGASCIGLILLLTFIVARLIRSREHGFSVRMQFFLALAGIVGAFAFGLGILVVDRVESRAKKLALAAASDEAYTIAAILQSEIKRTGAPFTVLASQLEKRSPDSPDWPADSIESMGLELLNLQGVPVFPEITRSRAQESGAVFFDSTVFQHGKPAGIVRVVKPTIVVEALLKDFAPTVLVICLVLGAAAAGAAAWIGRTIADPIEALSVYSQRVSQGERPKLPNNLTGREVNRLVKSIDTMQQRLEGRPFVETFAADLSHEIKNPVAAIRASAEVLADGALEEPEQARRFVKRIHEAAARIEHLLAELLSLAQVETRGPEHLDEVVLAHVVEEVLDSIPAREQRIRWSGGSLAKIRGDRGWLTRAVTNLVDNALHHSPENSEITLTLTESANELCFTTENEGTLDKYVQESLFRRFVTTRREQGGTGLGLSIVRAVAEAHAGHAELQSPGPPHVRFRLRLPLSGATS